MQSAVVACCWAVAGVITDGPVQQGGSFQASHVQHWLCELQVKCGRGLQYVVYMKELPGQPASVAPSSGVA